MKIKTQLTLLFTLIAATILLAFACVIYFSAKDNREKEFYSLLKKEAITKANLFFNAEVDKTILQDIYKNNRKILNEVEVAIFDVNANLLYHDAVDIDFVKETPQMITSIGEKREIQFYQEKWQVIGIVYVFNKEKFIVTAAAYDQYGYKKLSSLFRNSVIVFVISIFFIYIAGLYFLNKVFHPVKEMTDKAKNISATNLHLRLSNYNNKDELAELANTFNEMLERLENSFNSQKQFVSNISHELRTPLSAIITELELALSNSKNTNEYITTISNTLNDAKKLARLSNSLLDLAKASYDPTEITFKPCRIDEILLDAKQQVQQTNQSYSVAIHFLNDIENDEQLLVNGNAYLLKVAFVNLFENGCKFSSDKKANLFISFEKDKMLLRFNDTGIGISQQDLQSIFLPFYRGSNASFADGSGIGLSLTQKIITLHKGSISVYSEQNKFTDFMVALNHL